MVSGEIELWKNKSAGKYFTKELVEKSDFNSKEERKKLMDTWKRKHKIHWSYESRFWFFLIKPDDNDATYDD